MPGFFKSKIFWVAVLTVAVLTAMIVTTGGGKHFSELGNTNIISVVVSPVQKLITTAGESVKGFFSFFSEMKSFKDENDRMKLKIAQLEVENRMVNKLTDENKRLREALSLKQQFSDYEQVGSNIIAKDAGNWFHIFTIDKGTQDGIYKNAAVKNNEGLVGHILDASHNASKVLAIIDEDSTVSARLTKTRDIVILHGDLTLKDEGLCRLDYIPPDVDITVGDAVETSGLGGIFPKGIIIGTIDEVRGGGNDLSRYAIVRPNVDFKRLEEVYIMLDKNLEKK